MITAISSFTTKVCTRFEAWAFVSYLPYQVTRLIKEYIFIQFLCPLLTVENPRDRGRLLGIFLTTSSTTGFKKAGSLMSGPTTSWNSVDLSSFLGFYCIDYVVCNALHMSVMLLLLTQVLSSRRLDHDLSLSLLLMCPLSEAMPHLQAIKTRNVSSYSRVIVREHTVGANQKSGDFKQYRD